MSNAVVEGHRSLDFIKPHRVLLTQEEETKLFKQYQKARSKKKKKQLLEQIILHYSPIIRRAAKELAAYRADEEELISEGIIALMDAAGKFDPDYGYRFSTYAKQCCKGVMYGYITRNFFIVNVCTSHTKKRLFFAMRKLVAIELLKKGTFTMDYKTAERLAEEHKCSTKDVLGIYSMFKKPYDLLSDPVSVSESDELTKEHTLSLDQPTVEEIVVDGELVSFQQRMVEVAMERVLDERAREIFRAQELTSKEDTLTLEELGARFNISKERVRQIRNTARRDLTAELRRMAESVGLQSSDFLGRSE